MSNASPNLIVCHDPEHPRVMETLVHAFESDPVMAYFFPETVHRNVCLPELLKLSLRHGIARGLVETTDIGSAVGLWVPSENTHLSWIQQVRLGALRTAWTLGWQATQRVLVFTKWIESQRNRFSPQPHHYLFILAVHPDFQGHGLGSALVHRGLERARKTGRRCFLETANPKNREFYRRLGFREVYDEFAPNRGPRTWGFLSDSHTS